MIDAAKDPLGDAKWLIFSLMLFMPACALFWIVLVAIVGLLQGETLHFTPRSTP